MTDVGDGLGLLGDDLAGRARAVRNYLRTRHSKAHPGDQQRIRDLAVMITEAVEAAAAGDLPAAAKHIAAAEMLTDVWRSEVQEQAAAWQQQKTATTAAARLDRQRKQARQEQQAGDVRITDTVAVIKAGLRGRVKLPGPPDPYLVAACDGSYSGGRTAGWAYLTTAGQWGARGDAIGKDPSGSLLAELLAAGMVMDDLRPGEDEGILLADSLGAVGYLQQWRKGSTALPVIRGDDHRAPKRQKIVEGVRAKVPRHPLLEPMHVHGHRGHYLNEAADMLAKMALRWRSGRDRTEPEVMRRRCEEVAAAFLRSWYGAQPKARR